MREYWVVDPRPDEERADFWVLNEEQRYRPVPIDEDGVYRSTIIPGFWPKVDWLWTAPEQDAQLIFGQIANFPPEVVATLRQIAERGPA